MDTATILNLISNACDDYYFELNHGVMTLSDLDRNGVELEDLQVLAKEGKIIIDEVEVENPESANNNKIYVKVAYLPGTKVINTEY